MTRSNFIIAIDGPAASGKGTLAKRIAKALGYAQLDTGLLYRATAFKILEAGGDPKDEKAAIEAAENLGSDFSNPRFKDDDIGLAASEVASIPSVRKILLKFQHDFGRDSKGVVMDGRDIGTVIFPDADVKLFIKADVEIRARRRYAEIQSKTLQSATKAATYEAVLKDMRERDERDANRSAAPLKAAEDAHIIDTSSMSADEAFEAAMVLIRSKID